MRKIRVLRIPTFRVFFMLFYKWGVLTGVAQIVRFAFEGCDCSGAFDAVIDSTLAARSSRHPLGGGQESLAPSRIPV
ncbi:MAG: hypothetical protein FWD57_13015, partial [Polyangiaceae bacterium]|nr:hypothetical protein [Polyangiaceae bacterium]